jgi:hypothetical protein
MTALGSRAWALRRVLLLLALAGCGSGTAEQAKAYRITTRGQTVGGPAAIADVGDFILENGVIRVAILRDGNSPGPGMFGGSLVDIDLARHDGTHRPGRGLDAFAELMPMVNLMVPGYRDDPARRAHFETLSVEVLADGSEAACPVSGGKTGCAAIRATGKGDRLVEALGMIEQLQVRMNLSFETIYLLDPGADYVRIRTDVFIDNRWVDSVDPYLLGSVQPFMDEGLGVLDVLTGDELLPPEEPKVWRPGFLAGDFLLMGKKVKIFAPGYGFDFPNTFQRLFDEGKDILGTPQAADAVVGVGKGVSYAYGSENGPTIIPIFTGEFTGAFTHGMRCMNEDTACIAEETRPLRYERILAVGRGDVASAMAPMYRLRGETTGTLSGHVYDPRTGAGVPGAEVFVLRDPWAADAAAEFPATAERLLELLQTETGGPGVVTELGADLEGDPSPDGSFSGPVPPDAYFLVVRAAGRGLSQPVRVKIGGGKETEVSLAAGLPGRVDFEVFDETGSPSPAKLTFVGPIEPTAPCGPGAARATLTAQSTARPLPLGGGEIGNRVAAIAFTEDGTGRAELPPGRYDLWISRGFEYSVDRRCVEVPAYVAARVVGTVRREVDTTGWVTGDFHMHGANSYDADTTYEQRTVSAIAEGVEVLTMTDHDVVTDVGATVDAMGLRHRLAAAASEEVTPIETGHIIGFPLRYDARKPEGGAIDWTRRDACLADPGQPDCNHDSRAGYVLPLRPQEVFDQLRAMGALGPDDTLVFAPHPRDGFFGLFDQFGLNHFDNSFDSPGLMRGQHPLLRPEYFSWDFDAMELLNSKRPEMIRTPTVAEVSGFANDLAQLRADRRPEQEVADLHRFYAGLVLARTRAESLALRMGSAPECLKDEHCAAGLMCDLQRRLCVPEGTACTTDGDCGAGTVCLFETRPSRCIAECATDLDCRIDSKCDTSGERAHCIRRTCAPSEDSDYPCVQSGTAVRIGPVDDWFRLLNHGIVKTGLGNSDSHSLSSLETGNPRNFIYLGTDDPGAVDLRDVVQAIKDGRVVASTGPFVELFVNDRPIGDTVWVEPGTATVHVAVKVQWPSWFDVDRVEVYQAGELHPETFTPTQSGQIFEFDDDLPTRADGTPIDTWYVAIAMGVGSGAASMSPVYTANRHPYLGFTQVVATTFAAIDDPLIRAVLSMPLPVPEEVETLPYAITNPVFVDADGTAGYQAPAGEAPAIRWPE